MQYIGEHLFPGQIGHFLIILSLVSSIMATVSFYKAFKAIDLLEKKSWLRLAHIVFFLETAAVIGTFITLYYIISSHFFEYKYAWQHSSKSLQVEYLLSCFWEGQEGSFMLWSFWHCILGWIIITRSGKWEAPVMFVVSLAQACLATMLLGIYFGGYKVGSSPFVLLRNELQAPIFSQPNYLSFIKDGQGLNALLQNYWMVIHPPILFLGFASTLIPFAYAIAGFLTKDYKGWTVPSLPWALFSGAILGTGIMMGAAWAYESLTFGGYWAWDPVENASLVPWLVLIGGLHTNLIFKNSGYSLKSTFLFYILTFILILYSTFLTRSGILGDTSVHAFTDLGMNTQLILFILIFLIPALWLYIKNSKYIPTLKKEESSYSREFWMFIASLILFLSGLVIIGKTSIPVFNKVFGTHVAPPEDAEFSHNQIQIFIAIILGILTAITQYLRYKQTAKNVFFRRIIWPTIITACLTILVTITPGISYIKKGPVFHGALYLGIFSALYALVGNLLYIWKGLNGKLKLAGASVAHIGFGLVLLGILLSSGNKTVLSINKTGISPLKSDDPRENSLENTTLIKGMRTDMGQYDVTYIKDTANPHDHKVYYEIEFIPKDNSKPFKLYPDVIPNNKGGEGVTPNPDAKHFWNKDIFAYITYLSNPESKTKDTAQFYNQLTIIGDTTFYNNGMWVVNNIELNPADEKFHFTSQDTAFAANITVITKDGRQYKARPVFKLKNNIIEHLPDTIISQNLIFKLNKLVNVDKKQIEIGVKESSNLLDFITLKVYAFPHINILWVGVIITVIGFIMSIIRRLKPQKEI